MLVFNVRTKFNIKERMGNNNNINSLNKRDKIESQASVLSNVAILF